MGYSKNLSIEHLRNLIITIETVASYAYEGANGNSDDYEAEIAAQQSYTFVIDQMALEAKNWLEMVIDK